MQSLQFNTIDLDEVSSKIKITQNGVSGTLISTGDGTNLVIDPCIYFRTTSGFLCHENKFRKGQKNREIILSPHAINEYVPANSSVPADVEESKYKLFKDFVLDLDNYALRLVKDNWERFTKNSNVPNDKILKQLQTSLYKPSSIIDHGENAGQTIPELYRFKFNSMFKNSTYLGGVYKHQDATDVNPVMSNLSLIERNYRVKVTCGIGFYLRNDQGNVRFGVTWTPVSVDYYIWNDNPYVRESLNTNAPNTAMSSHEEAGYGGYGGNTYVTLGPVKRQREEGSGNLTESEPKSKKNKSTVIV